jgi:hypothetical protein
MKNILGGKQGDTTAYIMCKKIAKIPILKVANSDLKTRIKIFGRPIKK